MKNDFQKGNTAIIIVISFLVVASILAGVYFYLNRQLTELSTIPEMPEEEKLAETEPSDLTEEQPPEDLCQNECSRFGERECINKESYHICSYDAQNCLKWSPAFSCLEDAECQNGDCVKVSSEQKPEEPTEIIQCSSGPCCNLATQKFRPVSHVCHAKARTEYGCPWGEQAGSDIGVRYQNKYCSGSSADCTGKLKWSNWALHKTCSASEKCDSGKCVALKCADGTPYGQCSTDKPKYCENGTLIDKSSLCGCPSSYDISGDRCIFNIPKFDEKPGLVVIRQGTDGENFAREIASGKGWDLLITNTSDYQQIRGEIINFYNQKKFDYLLLIGTNDELPFAVYNNQKERWEGALTLYGDVNGDRFIELAVGVLPFSSESELKRYFTELEPKGNFITFESYTHHATKNGWWEYTYGKCLASVCPGVRSYKLTNPLTLAKHYRESAVIFLDDAGSADAVYSAGMPPDPNTQTPVLSIYSFCKNFNGDLLFTFVKGRVECEIEYLSNRPIVFHSSCNNAKELGRQLVENGAAAFLGHYDGGGFSIEQAGSKFLTGENIGRVVKDIYNHKILETTRIDGYGAVLNIAGLNTFDITKGEEIFGSTALSFILYGDPSLKLPKSFQKLNSNTAVEQQNDRIEIRVNPPELFPSDADVKSDEFTDLLCYAGKAVLPPSWIGREYWGKDHQIHLIFPITKVNRLKSQEAIIGEKKIILDLEKENYTISLLKGKTEQYLFISIEDTRSSPTEPGGVGVPAKTSRLDYTKNLEIVISYE